MKNIFRLYQKKLSALSSLIILDSSHLKVEGNWSWIWKLKVPPIIKHFTRRIQRDCLPTRAQLVQKGVSCTSTCTYCMSKFENAWHLFVNCPKAQEMWQQAGMRRYRMKPRGQKSQKNKLESNRTRSCNSQGITEQQVAQERGLKLHDHVKKKTITQLKRM